MIVLVVLCVTTLVARLAGMLGCQPLASWPAAVRVGLAAMFLFTAVAHFNAMRHDLARMMPPGIPSPMGMVYFTGLCEIAGAIGLLVPRTRPVAAWALIVLLLAILPANVHAARAGLTLGGKPVTAVAPRIAIQVVFIGLVWWSGVRAGGDRLSSGA